MDDKYFSYPSRMDEECEGFPNPAYDYVASSGVSRRSNDKAFEHLTAIVNDPSTSVVARVAAVVDALNGWSKRAYYWPSCAVENMNVIPSDGSDPIEHVLALLFVCVRYDMSTGTFDGYPGAGALSSLRDDAVAYGKRQCVIEAHKLDLEDEWNETLEREAEALERAEKTKAGK